MIVLLIGRRERGGDYSLFLVAVVDHTFVVSHLIARRSRSTSLARTDSAREQKQQLREPAQN